MPLADDVRRVRAEPGPVALSLALGLLVGVVMGLFMISDSGGRSRAATLGVAVKPVPFHDYTSRHPTNNDFPPASAGVNGTSPAGGASVPRDTSGYTRDALSGALHHGIIEADRTFDGVAEGAIVVDGWPQPAVVGSLGGPQRMWSMSKAVSAVAVYSLLRSPPSKKLRDALHGAISRSENCRQRRVVLGLQALARAAGTSAEQAFTNVLVRADIPRSDFVVPATPMPLDGEQACLQYLRGVWSRADAPALQLGTSTWRVADGARFALALAKGSAGPYGAASASVLRLMAEPKAPSQDPGTLPDDYTVQSQTWGAGNAFRRWDPSYKGGWGGATMNPPNYIVGQLVAMNVNGVAVGVMAVFHPRAAVAGDDPGKTMAPRALETIFDAVAKKLPLIHGRG